MTITTTMMTSEQLMTAAVLAAVIVAVAVVAFVVLRLRARRMSGGARKKVRAAWEHARGLSDDVRRILEADKVLDLALGELGYSGSLGEKLKQAGPRFTNRQAVWDAHKLRNALAHEAGVQVSPAQTERTLAVFERALRDLGM